jgi:thiamine biosynthesis lipoprotein
VIGRKMMYKFLFIIVFAFFYGCQNKGVTFEFSGKTMGTTFMVKIANIEISKIQKKKIKNDVEQALSKVNQQMSTWIPNSEISRFNRLDKDTPFKVSKEFVQVLMMAIKVNNESNGAFDVTVGPLVDLWGFGKKEIRQKPPTISEINKLMKNIGTHHIKVLNDSMVLKTNPSIELDFGAIAKGYGVDVVSQVIIDLKYNNFLVEIGGEVVVRGLNGDNFWKIGIDRPTYNSLPGTDLQAILKVSDLAMATSGDYRNYFISEDSVYSHTIDPLTGRPIINGVAATTILAPSCMEADAIATAIMVLGEEKGIKWIESKDDVEAMIIIREEESFREVFSSGFREYIFESER